MCTSTFYYRHRFQKPKKNYFWSRQTEALLASTFQQTRNLTRVQLPCVNDPLLKSLAVHCRKIQELEIQLALDASDEGLMAIAGRSTVQKDQGNPGYVLYKEEMNGLKEFPNFVARGPMHTA